MPPIMRNSTEQHKLTGGHVIALGPNNQQQVLQALSAYPKGMQFGGGVNLENASSYLEAGASHIIVTSYLFENGEFSWSAARGDCGRSRCRQFSAGSQLPKN